MVHAAFMEWKNRRAVKLHNGSMELVVLAGGGHLAELRLLSAGASLPNLLWESPWLTADPDSGEFARLASLYGGAPVGPFLAGYTGHTLCLDVFGLPSRKEGVDGIPLHGEASTNTWELAPAPDGCVAHVELPLSQMEFTRTIRAGKGQNVLFVEEWLKNTGRKSREVHWVQHVSLGPPFLTPESGLYASVDRCRTWPDGYEGRQILSDNRDFNWPFAPTINGGATDLRVPFQHGGKGFLSAARVAPTSPIAWILAMDPHARCALVYCFRRDAFPWIALWEENGARSYPPWNGSTEVRGMEFGTTPMPLGREAIHAMGELFDTPVACRLAAGERRYARYTIAAGMTPPQWRDADAVAVSASAITLTNAGNPTSVVIAAEGIRDFLEGGHGDR